MLQHAMCCVVVSGWLIYCVYLENIRYFTDFIHVRLAFGWFYSKYQLQSCFEFNNDQKRYAPSSQFFHTRTTQLSTLSISTARVTAQRRNSNRNFIIVTFYTLSIIRSTCSKRFDSQFALEYFIYSYFMLNLVIFHQSHFNSRSFYFFSFICDI